MIARLRSGFVHRMAVRDNAASSRAAMSRRSLRAAALAIAAAGVIALLVCLSIEFRRRQALYWYDVREDYRFEFSGPRTTRLVVDVSAEGFEFPATNAVWDTVVLRLRVDSGWAARWYEPSITLDSGGDSTSRQFFERGARGERYLLVPSTVRPGQRVGLRGAGMYWVPQHTELLLWDNAVPSGATVLVLAPHPDDAEIAAFGLYSTTTSYVVTVTAGNYPDKGYAHLYADPAAQDRLTARIRTWDSLAVPLWGGVPPERIVNLGYAGLSLDRLDAEHGSAVSAAGPSDARFAAYRRGAVQQLLGGRAASDTWGSLVDDMAGLLDSVRPDVIVAPHPRLDDNDDHQLTTVALLEALETRPGASSTLLMYTNHHVLSEYYPFGPADSNVTLPPWFDQELAFSGVYSHTLDRDTQIDKLFALEANHDLRAAPRRLRGAPADRFLERLWLAIRGLVRDPVADYSYFRRAVRPNELFFVYAPEERKRLAAVVAGGGRTRPVAGLR